jgi:hypothetical protein
MLKKRATGSDIRAAADQILSFAVLATASGPGIEGRPRLDERSTVGCGQMFERTGVGRSA